MSRSLTCSLTVGLLLGLPAAAAPDGHGDRVLVILSAKTERGHVPAGLDRAAALPGVDIERLDSSQYRNLMPCYELVVAGSRATVAEARGARDPHATGLEAMCGVAGAMYMIACWSKLQGSGLAWASATNLSTHITIHAYGGEPWLRPLRLAVADVPLLTGTFGVLTLLLEGGGFLFAVPRLRPFLAVGLVGLHAGIGLFMGLHHYDWMLTALALGFVRPPTPSPRRTAARRSPAPSIATT